MTKRVIKEVSAAGKISRKKIASVVSAVHVTASSSGAWQVRKAGKDRITANFPSKEAAVEYARGVSAKRGVDLIVHDNGKAKTVNNLGYSSLKDLKPVE